MIFIVVATFFVAACTTTMSPDTPDNQPGIKITNYGIYIPIGDLKRVSNDGVPSGGSYKVAGWKFLETTDRIPAMIGIRFGMEYIFTG